MKPIEFSQHALLKIAVLARHGLTVRPEFVEEVIRQPEKVDVGYKGRRIAQRSLNPDHVLRVVFEEDAERILVVTLYPGRRSRYDKD